VDEAFPVTIASAKPIPQAPRAGAFRGCSPPCELARAAGRGWVERPDLVEGAEGWYYAPALRSRRRLGDGEPFVETRWLGRVAAASL
jgi:hypothetical protein